MSSVITASIERIHETLRSSAEDILAVEEPLEIRLSFVEEKIRIEKNISITMRTPGNDEELALGFLYTEGIVIHKMNIKSILTPKKNCVVIELENEIKFNIGKLEKHFYTSSSCGVCGKTSIDAINTINKPAALNNCQFSSSLIKKLPQLLRDNQSVFEKTGGLHASAMFDKNGALLIIREDVGRHNALDKVIGAALIKEIQNLNEHLLILSGRASFELIQKAAMAGIYFVAAVGAPSSLAVELANERGITLVGFLRENRYNIYTGCKNIID
jgi:FdhD protein